MCKYNPLSLIDKYIDNKNGKKIFTNRYFYHIEF
ncbi:unnamed protein product [Fructobacillus evanidus]|uniref:Uncharacterized protein n=1 Tax=Fructobacillus evanidus TaxID=3064281 RepID=A0ABN9YVE5_9LACO|nr:unnamed protein product [Fructobacillus sp. LMG 32999]CAK1248721.1 unnamed protein product [Fructobacillus sp. LMG 32999]